MKRARQDSSGKHSHAAVPGPHRTVLRERLFALIEAAAPRRAVWIASEAGSGKTTLASSYIADRRLPAIWYRLSAADSDLPSFFHYLSESVQRVRSRRKQVLPYLTPEYLSNVAAFARRYFSDMLKGWRPPYVVILDDFQEALLESPLVDIVKVLIDVLPADATLIVLSRNLPPPPFARLIAIGDLVLIGSQELRFTLEETRELAQRFGCRDEELIAECAHRARGWASGIVLLLQHGVPYRFMSAVAAEQVLFDYFVAELYAGIEPEIRNVMLRSAFAPNVNAEEAVQLSGNPRAPALLARLSRENAFVYRDAARGTFEYHPLFRDFLVKHAAAELAPDEFHASKRLAAKTLESGGRHEAAAEIYMALGEWNSLEVMITSSAPLLLSQGRVRLLHDWIAHMPAKHVEQSPDLLYWLGISGIPLGPREAKATLSRAYEAYRAANDSAKAMLACCGVLQAYGTEMDSFRGAETWVGRLEEMLPSIPDDLPAEIDIQLALAFEAVRWRLPGHPLLKDWIEHARRRIPHTTPSPLLMAYVYSVTVYDIWLGEIERCASLLPLGRSCASMSSVPVLFRFLWLAMEQVVLCAIGDFHASRECARRAERYMEELGFPAAISLLAATSAHLGTCSSTPQSARADLERATPFMNMSAGMQISHYDYVRTLIAFALGDTDEAQRLAERNLERIQGLSIPYITAVYQLVEALILIEKGEPGKAEPLIEKAEAFGKCIRSAHFVWTAALYRALVCLQRRDGRAAEFLQAGLSLARSKGTMIWDISMPSAIASRLAEAALASGVEVAYVKEVIRRCGLAPGSLDTANWPWPVRIDSLGAFEVSGEQVDAQPKRKASHQPLLLLKLLLVNGARDVDGAMLAHQLWKDASGDDAENALSATLHRLRRHLGREDAVLRQDNKLSLNDKVCFWDIWAFGRLVEACKAVPRGQQRDPQFEQRAERALSLYGGAFLDSDRDLPGAAKFRERLRQQLHTHIARVGGYFESRQLWEPAERFYRRAVEAEPLSEVFYRQLIQCLQSTGRHAEALDTYYRCRDVLVKELGTAPSAATRELIDGTS